MPDSNRYARKTYSPDGVNPEFIIDIPYQQATELHFELSGEPQTYGTHWTLTSPTTARFVTVPPSGSNTLVLTRNTDIENPAATFTSPGTFTFGNLNRIIKQLLFGVQESHDRSIEAETILGQAQDAANSASEDAARAEAASAEVVGKAHTFANWAALQAYSGPATSGILDSRAVAGDEGGGAISVIEGDTETPDDGALTGVDALGRRWRRNWSGARLAAWWGVREGATSTANAAALNAALAALPAFGGHLVCPAGDFPIKQASLSGKFHCVIEGAGQLATRFYLDEAGVLLSILGGNFVTIRRMGFSINGAPQSITGSTGLRIADGAGNTVVEECAFLGFSDSGLSWEGSVGTQMSGHEVWCCNFLGNGGAQLYGLYSNDYIIAGNQYGNLDGVTPATEGCRLDNCGAGSVTLNYHWTNDVGLMLVGCDEVEVGPNRLEINLEEGGKFDSCPHLKFISNRVYSNSLGGYGVSDNLSFTDCLDLTFDDNDIFTWDASYSRWGASFNGTCSISFGVNRVAPNSYDADDAGPYFISGDTIAAGINANLEIGGASISVLTSAMASGKYIGSNGEQDNSWQTPCIIGGRYQLVYVKAFSTNSPGGGFTYTHTVDKTGAPTSMSATQTGSPSFEASIPHTVPPIVTEFGDYITVHSVVGAGAGSAAIRWVGLLVAC